MRRIIGYFIALLLLAACSDTFNDPNPGYVEIIDTQQPEIRWLNLSNDTVIRGTDRLDLQIEFADDLLLDVMTFELYPFDNSAPKVNMTRYSEDTVHRIDTFYIIPAHLDSLEISLGATCDDYANNSTTSTINLKIFRF